MDPFYETQETHNLIGVASIYLEVLFSDVTLDYSTPVISQQGEVAGRLQVRQYGNLTAQLDYNNFELYVKLWADVHEVFLDITILSLNDRHS